jgi:hypothetical protein
MLNVFSLIIMILMVLVPCSSVIIVFEENSFPVVSEILQL